jgi:uncharacterized membrane protein YraQ (UPF0718 family)
MMSVLSVSAGK